METDALIAVLWFFVLSFVACATLYVAVDRGNRTVQRRLRDVAMKFRISQGRYDDESLVDRGLAETLLQWAQRRMPAPDLEKPAVAKLVSTIQYAGFYSPAAPRVFQVIRLAMTAGGALLGYITAIIIGGSALVFVAAGAALGYLAPLYLVRSFARSRQAKIRREITDVVDLLVVCVECGLGLLASMRIVGRECERQGRITGGQLGTLSAELTAGASLGEGLRGMAQRTGVDEIKTFSAILIQSEKLGTEMAQALRATAGQLRVKRSMRAEEMAQKLPIKMVFPLIFFLLPAMMMILIGPEMVEIFRSFNFR